MHTTCIGLHVVQRSAVSADPAIRLIVEAPPVSVRNTPILRAVLCRSADVTFPTLSCSAYRTTLVIGQFIKRCLAKRPRIDWRICVNLWLKTGSVNGGVFLVHNLKCLVSVCGRRQNTENERNLQGPVRRSHRSSILRQIYIRTGRYSDIK